VRTPSGNVGWIADYFLSEDMVSRDQLVSLQSQITQLTENRIQTQNQLDASIQLSETLKKDVTTLASEKMALEQRLSDLNELTQEAQRIVEQNANSTFAIASLEQRLQASEDATAKLQQSNEQKWFIIGAGTLFIGFLIGLLFSMTRKKKPNTGTWV
jgi:SH3 domain protein